MWPSGALAAWLAAAVGPGGGVDPWTERVLPQMKRIAQQTLAGVRCAVLGILLRRLKLVPCRLPCNRHGPAP